MRDVNLSIVFVSYCLYKVPLHMGYLATKHRLDEDNEWQNMLLSCSSGVLEVPETCCHQPGRR